MSLPRILSLALAMSVALPGFAQGIRYDPPVRGVKINELISSELNNPQRFAFRAPKWGTYLSEIILKTVDDAGDATRIQTPEHIVLDFRASITDPIKVRIRRHGDAKMQQIGEGVGDAVMRAVLIAGDDTAAHRAVKRELTGDFINRRFQFAFIALDWLIVIRAG